MILDRRRYWVTQRQRTTWRVHALLAKLALGARRASSPRTEPLSLLRTARPTTLAGVERRQIAKELLEEWRWLDRRLPLINQRLKQTLETCDTTLTELHGIATVVGPPRHNRSQDRIAAMR